uniref:MPN domain-containing protein n=1 Tax=Elaeophora elaphi TaxID=1147741 RepID=A0A0R3RHL2_9BILA
MYGHTCMTLNRFTGHQLGYKFSCKEYFKLILHSHLPKSAPRDVLKHPDTGETLYVSSLALLKMLRHSRSGVPMEVMGLMLGEFIDDFTINVVDVFAMPQTGTVYMLNRTGRAEMVVGWYHSHPGFGCWLSGVDIATQRSFEALSDRAVALVIDPIQSVKGKVVIDAFRTIPPNTLQLSFLECTHRILAPTQESRQTTSNLGHLIKHSVIEQLHGLGKSYYSITISFKLTVMEQQMLQSLHMKNWAEGLQLNSFDSVTKSNLTNMQDMVKMIELYNKELYVTPKKQQDEKEVESKKKSEKVGTETTKALSKAEIEAKKVGRFDPKRHLATIANDLMKDNIVHELRSMIDASAFQ